MFIHKKLIAEWLKWQSNNLGTTKISGPASKTVDNFDNLNFRLRDMSDPLVQWYCSCLLVTKSRVRFFALPSDFTLVKYYSTASFFRFFIVHVLSSPPSEEATAPAN